VHAGCRARGRSAAAGPAAGAVGQPTLRGGPVRLRPVRATPCLVPCSNFLYMLTIAVARSFSDVNAQIALCISGFVVEAMLSYNGARGPKSKTTLCFVEFARWQMKLLFFCCSLVIVELSPLAPASRRCGVRRFFY